AIGAGEDIHRVVANASAPAARGLVAVESVPGGHIVWLHRDGRTLELPAPGRPSLLTRRLAALERTMGPVAPELRAAMPGTVVSVGVADGDPVAAGAAVLTIEAMKMEHALAAPHAGTVRLRVRPGDLVRRD